MTALPAASLLLHCSPFSPSLEIPLCKVQAATMAVGTSSCMCGSGVYFLRRGATGSRLGSLHVCAVVEFGSCCDGARPDNERVSMAMVLAQTPFDGGAMQVRP
jgi:hypothetical protein